MSEHPKILKVYRDPSNSLMYKGYCPEMFSDEEEDEEYIRKDLLWEYLLDEGYTIKVTMEKIDE